MRDRPYYERIIKELTREQVRSVYLLSKNSWTRGTAGGRYGVSSRACKTLVRLGLAEADSNDLYLFFALNDDGYQVQRLLWGLDVGT